MLEQAAFVDLVVSLHAYYSEQAFDNVLVAAVVSSVLAVEPEIVGLVVSELVGASSEPFALVVVEDSSSFAVVERCIGGMDCKLETAAFGWH